MAAAATSVSLDGRGLPLEQAEAARYLVEIGVLGVPVGRANIMAGRKGAEHATNILGVLAEASRPLSAYDLLDKLRPTGVAAPLTVYRALDKLIASGKVHRIESLNAFVACRDGDHQQADHHHESASAAPRRAVGFTICDTCGGVEEFVDGKLFMQLERGLATKRFTPRSSAIEVHGLCAACTLTEREAGPSHAPTPSGNPAF